MAGKFGKSGGGKKGMSSKLLHTPSNAGALGKKGGMKKGM